MTTSLGRRHSPDLNDLKYLMRRKLPAAGTAMPTTKTWGIRSVSLDQGKTSTCVGHAWKNFLRCEPLRTEKGPSAYDIYRKAITLDPWTDNDGEVNLPDGDSGLQSGTSVRAGAQALIDKNLKSYLWAFNLQAVIEWVLTEGPVVLGTNWYSSMDNVNGDGMCRITSGATIVGGHAYLIRAANRKRGLFTGENSWGDDWGRNGSFIMSFEDLERLIHEDGEACTAVEKKVQKAA